MHRCEDVSVNGRQHLCSLTHCQALQCLYTQGLGSNPTFEVDALGVITISWVNPLIRQLGTPPPPVTLHNILFHFKALWWE